MQLTASGGSAVGPPVLGLGLGNGADMLGLGLGLGNPADARLGVGVAPAAPPVGLDEQPHIAGSGSTATVIARLM